MRSALIKLQRRLQSAEPQIAIRRSPTNAALHAAGSGPMSEHEDLNWLAFRYVAGELNAAELRAFETQLEDDQSAREAVARACELTCCITAAERDRVAAEERGRPAPRPIAPVSSPVALVPRAGPGCLAGGLPVACC